MSAASSSVPSSHSGRMAKLMHTVFHIGPDPAVKARIIALRASIASIKQDIDTRSFLIDLLFANGLHCQSCSSAGKVGACGPTCALLRPRGSAVFPGLAEGMTDSWMRNTVSFEIRYDKLAPVILSSGYKVSIATVQQWQEAVRRLQKRLE